MEWFGRERDNPDRKGSAESFSLGNFQEYLLSAAANQSMDGTKEGMAWKSRFHHARASFESTRGRSEQCAQKAIFSLFQQCDESIAGVEGRLVFL
jgi:hypothetical protein